MCLIMIVTRSSLLAPQQPLRLVPTPVLLRSRMPRTTFGMGPVAMRQSPIRGRLWRKTLPSLLPTFPTRCIPGARLSPNSPLPPHPRTRLTRSRTRTTLKSEWPGRLLPAPVATPAPRARRSRLSALLQRSATRRMARWPLRWPMLTRAIPS